jgi:hypothetical protein
MAEDSLKWIAAHIAAGIELREQGWNLRSAEEAEAWRRRENKWASEALDGMAAWNLRDFGRVNDLIWVDTYPLPSGHPWRDIRFNPLNCHLTRIKRLQQIEQEWLQGLARPDMTASDTLAAVNTVRQS